MALVLLLSACGESPLMDQFRLASAKQTDVNANQLNLWMRSPTADSGNANLTAQDNLDTLTRSPLIFDASDGARSAIASSALTVYEDSSRPRVPSLFDWAGRFLSFRRPEFGMFFGFYHTHKAMDYAAEVFSEVNFYSSSNPVYPLTLYAAEKGNALDTAYDPGNRTMRFYVQSSGTGKDFNPVHEADAVYHEYAHALQQAIHLALLEVPFGENASLDALLEGTADFYAAAVLRDPNILSYLRSNAPLVISPADRLSTSHRRELNHSLYFPNFAVEQAHLDGRVLAAALDDMRRYLEGQAVTLWSQCTSPCSVQNTNLSYSRAIAYDQVNRLAMRVLSADYILPTVTLARYSDRLLYACVLEFGPGGGGLEWCSSSVSSDFRKILLGRGLISPYSHISGAGHLSMPFSGTEDAITAVVQSPALGWLPFSEDQSRANGNSDIEPCEVGIIFPRLKNNTNLISITDTGNAAFVDWKIELGEVFGFTEFLDSRNEPIDELSLRNTKIFGWLLPGEWSLDMVRNASSRWYNSALGSTFMRKMTRNLGPSPVGWFVEAPAQVGATVSAQFRVSFRLHNSDSNAFFVTNDLNPGASSDDYFLQSSTVVSGTDFCPDET
jgi:hypothetical protein